MSAAQPQAERDWRQEPLTFDRYHFELIFAVIAIIAAILIGRALFAGDDGYWSNVYMTVLGVVITILVLDRQAERREQQREERELKAQLIRDTGSSVNDVAKNTVDQIRKRRWLEGDTGILAGAKLERANLQGADLVRANLQEVNLWGADLQEANLRSANLQGADLGYANLQETNLTFANLQKAILAYANLQGTYLGGANLRGAN